MTNMLGIITADVQHVLNPTNDPDRFQVGTGLNQYPTAHLEEIIAYWDDYVCSRLPEQYRRHLSEVTGEIVCDYATDAQPTVTLSLTPITSGTVYLYVNWPTTTCYSSRSKADALASDEFTIVTGTGVVTLVDTLDEGDRVYADYGHSAFGGCLYLKRIVLLFIQADIVKQLGGFGDKDARAAELERQAYGDLDRLKRGEAGLNFIDRLKLVSEYETRNDAGVMEFPLSGGYL